MYEVVVTLHVLSAFAWVGGGFVLILGVRNIRAKTGQAAADEFVAAFDSTTRPLFATAPPMVLLTGIAQVLMGEQHDWSHLWITLSLSLFVVVAIMGGVVGGRWEKRMREARDAARSVAGLFDRWMRLNWAEWGLLLVIVALMVFKPL